MKSIITRPGFINILCIIFLITNVFNQTAFDESVKAKTSIGYVHTSGQKLLDGSNKNFISKGIAFGNNVWSNPSLPPTNHHTADSYKELSLMGFNSIRFYINYALFEDDNTPYQYKQSGWDWLNKNIAWAKKYNIKLVLNMHYPQGGYQSNGNGMELWTKKDNQTRLIALWKEIARRYKNEPAVMAFDLLNEPNVPELTTEEKTFQQWKHLAQKIVTAIRLEDNNHMIIIERLNASKNISTGQSNWDPNRNGNMNFFLIKDKNIAYEFHIYEPMEFTHQNASWIEAFRGTKSKYPDKDAVKTIGVVNWEGYTNTNPTLNKDKTGWQYLQGKRFKIDNTSYMFAQPTLQARNTGTEGSVWFDDLIIKEYDENDKFVRTINNYQFEIIQDWSLWQAGSSVGYGKYDPVVGHDGKGAMRIAGTTDDANLSTYIERIKLQQGHSYEISGYVLSDKLSSSSDICIRLDFFSCDSIITRGKDLLKLTIDQYIKFGKDNNIPLYHGEFGCISYAFHEDRGGDRFVSDLLDICKENNLSFNYHAYHEEAFGLYQNSSTMLPAQPNKLLMEVLKTKLK